jgi:hypothetical protein
MELTQGSETSANHNMTPGKYPEENIQYSNHGESLKSRIIINPLTPELNPSKQCCLLEFFTRDFKFYCLLLELKKHIS